MRRRVSHGKKSTPMTHIDKDMLGPWARVRGAHPNQAEILPQGGGWKCHEHSRPPKP